MWKTHSKETNSWILIEGDPSVPPTKWWNHLYLLLCGWKTVQVFKVPKPVTHSGYRVGYATSNSQPKICNKIRYSSAFRMRIGNEDCRFFAVDMSGNEITLQLVARTNKRDEMYRFAPLY